MFGPIAAAALALTATAAPAGPAAPAKSRAATLARFVGEQTAIVIRIDAARIDAAAVAANLRGLVGGIDTDEKVKKAVAAEIDRAVKTGGQFKDAFVKAGGNELYLFVQADLTAMPLFAVVPLAEPAKAEDMIRWLRSHAGPPPSSGPRPPRPRPAHMLIRPEVCKQIGGAIYAGPKAWLELIQAGKSQPPAELAEALAAAGDGALQVLIAPPAHARRVIAETMPQLPAEIGGGPSSTVTEGLRWAAISVDVSPKLSVRVVIRSRDAAAAKAMHELTRRALTLLAANAEVRKHIPAADKIARRLLPQVRGDRLVLQMDQRQINATILEVIAPPLRRARGTMTQVASAANMSQIVKALLTYAVEHDGRWPEDLQALLRAKTITPKRLINPRRPELKVGYVYVRPGDDLADAYKTIVLYEVYKVRIGRGINVAYADGHVEFMKDEERFNRLLAASMKRSPGGAKR